MKSTDLRYAIDGPTTNTTLESYLPIPSSIAQGYHSEVCTGRGVFSISNTPVRISAYIPCILYYILKYILYKYILVNGL